MCADDDDDDDDDDDGVFCARARARGFLLLRRGLEKKWKNGKLFIHQESGGWFQYSRARYYYYHYYSHTRARRHKERLERSREEGYDE